MPHLIWTECIFLRLIIGSQTFNPKDPSKERRVVFASMPYFNKSIPRK